MAAYDRIFVSVWGICTPAVQCWRLQMSDAAKVPPPSDNLRRFSAAWTRLEKGWEGMSQDQEGGSLEKIGKVT